MTNPNDPWARPDETPTEHLGRPGKSGTEPLHTDDYPAAYGEPTTAYPGNGPYDAWAQGPNPTRELPTYDGRWDTYGAYGQPSYPTGYPDGAWSAGEAPAQPQEGPPRPPERRTGLWLGIGLAVVVLIGLAGVAAGLLFGGGDSSPPASDGGTSTVPTRRAPTGSLEPSGRPPALPSIPGMPGLDESVPSGTTMGTITANDGVTLTISSIGGSNVIVRTDRDTQVISLSGTTVADLPKGDLILVQGDKAPDGSITAKVIISTAVPGGGR